MKKKLSAIYTFLLFVFLGALTLLVLLFALLQTKTAQKYVIQTLITRAKKEGVALTINDVQGIAPFNWSLGSVHLSTPHNSLALEGVDVEIAFFPLLQKKLTIRSLTVSKMAFAFASSKQSLLFSKTPTIRLPFDFSTNTLSIDTLSLHDLQSDKQVTLKMSGKAKISGNLQEILLNLQIEEPLYNNSFQLSFLSSKKKDSIQGDAFIVIRDAKQLSCFFDLDMLCSFEANAFCLGKWSFWPDLKKKSGDSPLSLTIATKITALEILNFPFLDRSWSLQGDFFLWPDLSSFAKSFSIESDWIRMLGKANFSSSLSPISGSTVITLKDLSEFNLLVPFKLAGEMVIKAALSETDCLFAIKSDALQVGNNLFSPALSTTKGSLRSGVWKGTSAIELKNDQLPWKGSLEFSLENKRLTIDNLLMETTGTKLSGIGQGNLEEANYEGSFFVLGENLRIFRTLFPRSDLEGSLGGDICVSYHEEKLNLSSHLLLKNIRYQSSLVDTIGFSISMTDLLKAPSGSLLLDSENIFLKGGEIHKLYLISKKEETGEHFSLTASGKWKEPFSISSQGSWKKNGNDYFFSISEGFGEIFGKEFSLEPFSCTKTEKTASLVDFSLTIGEGSFKCFGSIESDNVTLKTEASHLPLDLVSLFYPNLSLSGIASFTGKFSASEEKTGGAFLATLEQASFSHVKAKGALQAHINDVGLQIHSHIYAINDQFLDWTATIPIEISLNPFSLRLSQERPISSEMTMQGAIEELFDFLQSGTHKTSGWITSHLLLSGNIQEPFLLGETTLQKGSYENYMTGTKLQEIKAQIIATGNVLEAKHFSFQDKESGTATGSGSLFLKPKQQFPFALSAEMKNLELVHSETLTLQTTGNILILGNREKAKASGSLTVDSALFSIADSLPVEIPVLPITFINKPIHLQRSEVLIPPSYPIFLDVTLESKQKVFIKGKGLNSEWYGNLDITGTPLSPIAKGSLTLKQGEFKFSGKTFSLMSGDLSFSDQIGQNGYLKIHGQLQLQDTMISALLQGPLTSPRLTFQSSPALPTSSILSLILFNKDISDINPMQTLQLAQVIVSLSGSGGPDVLEAIRKGIGIDRLSIGEKDGSEELAIQIGWHIAKGITVSLSQSKSSSDIKVEVDLKNGFIFEAETQNQEEGKFSLKWNKNY